MNGHDAPLAGAILCCTAIAPEERTKLASVAAQMGATIKLDLTSDVTHLVVGSIDSAKYRYVAKSREDVKVLAPDFLEALRVEWMDGEDHGDVAALEEQFRLPTFYNLRICLTGFDDPEQRKFIQEATVQNGAEYHGDLTKNVTHLITATPSGKKYEHALNWQVKVVSWEWFEQSIQRGMALEEQYFNPTIPVEHRGQGAWDRRRSMSPTLTKRARDPEPTIEANPLRRKLRRSASNKIGSQSQALWAGITAVSFGKSTLDQDDWTDVTAADLSTDGTEVTALIANGTDAQPEDPALEASSTLPLNSGLFEGRIVFTYSFDLGKTRILREHLENNGAVVVEYPADLLRHSTEDLERGYLVVPHDQKADLTALPVAAGTMTLVTHWWVERCLHAKCLVDSTEHVLCRPFESLTISGFDGLTINPTGFVGIELLHLSKAVTLMGAKYEEFLNVKTSVLVCNTPTPNPAKLKLATDRGIPAVHAAWLWECLRTGQRKPYENYLLNRLPLRQGQPRDKHQQSHKEVPTAPLSEEEHSKMRQMKTKTSKLKPKPQSRHGSKQPRALALTLSADPTPASTTASSATLPNTNIDSPLDDDEPIMVGLDGPSSFPLQNINPCVNSPRRASTSSIASNAKSTADSKSASNASRKQLTPAPTSDAKASTPIIEPVPEEKDYSSIMSNILAQRKAAAEQINNKEDDPRKRRRQLGRAPSTVLTSEGTFSRRGSEDTSIVYQAILEGGLDTVPDEDKLGNEKVPEYQPSQELGWDAPDAQEARERMIRAMGGTVADAGGVVERLGVVRDVVRGEGVAGRGRRKR